MPSVRTFITCAIVAAAGSFAATPLFAADTATPPAKHEPGALFDRFDANHDGKLTESEVPAKLWERISAADADKDGAVTKEELAAFHKEHGTPGERFAKLDKNGDGKISKDEAPKGMAEHFDQIDKNGDGFITKDELQAAGFAEHFKKKDANNDGKLSLEEFGGKEEVFKKIDANGDGFITPDELKAAMKQRQEHHGEKTTHEPRKTRRQNTK